MGKSLRECTIEEEEEENQKDQLNNSRKNEGNRTNNKINAKQPFRKNEQKRFGREKNEQKRMREKTTKETQEWKITSNS